MRRSNLVNSTPQYILLMKAGPYCGYSLEEIIDIKQKEERAIGKFFWGYSGVFCRPPIVQNLGTHAHTNNHKVLVLFSETKSAYTSTTTDSFTDYSHDGVEWKEIPKEVLLVGNTEKPHFAITANNLKSNKFEIDISQYCLLDGMFPNQDRYLDNYFRYRVDKAYGYHLPRKNAEKRMVTVNYTAELVAPFAMNIMRKTD